jgi:RNA polymerase sigma-70 factor, ECF subfamily
MNSLEKQPDWTTSSDLVSRVKRHDRDAWDRFVALYAPLIYVWCRRAGVAAAESADVTQEVFAKAFAGIEQFRHDREGDTLRGWLRVIFRRKLIDFAARRAGRPAAAGGTDANAMLHQAAADEDDEISRTTDRQTIVRRAAELVRGEFETRTWMAFWLTAVEGQTAPEAGRQLGMSAGAVRQAKCAVLNRLREELHNEIE